MKTTSLKIFYIFFILLFLYIPIITLIIYSFNDATYSTVWSGFTLKWYRHLAENDQLINAALNSLIVAILSSTIAVFLGTITSVALYRYSFYWKKFLYYLIFIVLMSPDIVMGISWLMLFSFFNLDLGFLTLLLSHIAFSFPFVAIVIYSRLRGLDKYIVEAAYDLGAGDFIIFRYIIFPSILPAVITSWLLSFTLSMDDVLVSFFVAGPTFDILPLRIYSMVKLGVKPDINALSAIIFLFTIIIVVITQLISWDKKRG